VPLPRAAQYVTLHEGFRAPRVGADAIEDQLVAAPGAHRLAFAYSVAGIGEVDLDRRVVWRIERLEVFTLAPAETRSPHLAPGARTTIEGRTFTRASGRFLAPGALGLTVTGVPANARWPAPAAAAMLAGVLAIGLAGAAVRARRSLGRRPAGA
jgi:hypothetical protein